MVKTNRSNIFIFDNDLFWIYTVSRVPNNWGYVSSNNFWNNYPVNTCHQKI